MRRPRKSKGVVHKPRKARALIIPGPEVEGGGMMPTAMAEDCHFAVIQYLDNMMSPVFDDTIYKKGKPFVPREFARDYRDAHESMRVEAAKSYRKAQRALDIGKYLTALETASDAFWDYYTTMHSYWEAY